MDEQITCNILNNALDYLLLAGEQAKDGSNRMLKHATATLFDGVELLLKARLEMDDWALLFKKETEAERAKYESGNFQSVTFDQAVERLRLRCSITINGTHLSTLNILRQLRNQVRHFALSTNRPTVISLIVSTYSFALDFLNESLAFSGHDNGDLMIADLRSLLGDFEEFVAERLSVIEPEMNSLDVAYVTCPICVQVTFFGQDGIATCLFCGHKCVSLMAVDEWMNRVHWICTSPEAFAAWMKHSPGICPDCDEATCVLAEGIKEGLIYVCLSCGQGGKYAECGMCEELVNEEGRCSGCSRASPTVEN